MVVVVHHGSAGGGDDCPLPTLSRLGAVGVSCICGGVTYPTLNLLVYKWPTGNDLIFWI